MKTLVVGATGLLGLEVCKRLGESVEPVRCLVRPTADGSKRAALEALGVELVEGDLKDPASLARACAGVQAVISTASSTFSRQEGDSIASVDDQGQLALVEAARLAGSRPRRFETSGRPRAGWSVHCITAHRRCSQGEPRLSVATFTIWAC